MKTREDRQNLVCLICRSELRIEWGSQETDDQKKFKKVVQELRDSFRTIQVYEKKIQPDGISLLDGYIANEYEPEANSPVLENVPGPAPEQSVRQILGQAESSSYITKFAEEYIKRKRVLEQKDEFVFRNNEQLTQCRETLKKDGAENQVGIKMIPIHRESELEQIIKKRQL